MKVSVITVVYNNEDSIEDCIKSVLCQTHADTEYIVIDGGSTDGTGGIIGRYADRIDGWISEPDEGIYDAMNKGIRASTGDLVGILNSDDLYYSPTVLENIAKTAQQQNVQSVYGDIVYVNRSDTRVIRHWHSGEYIPGSMQKGWMPPHPAFFVRRDVYEQYGCYDTGYRISADYDMMLRLLHRHGISAAYFPGIVTKMRWGGRSSTISNYFVKYKEDLRAMRENGIDHPFLTLLRKNVSKLPQFFIK